MFDKKLTNRELEVIKQLSMGLDTETIADNLSFSTHTIKSHIRNITYKLGLSNIHSCKSIKDKIVVWYFREYLGIKEDLI
jgi:DNA-binding NarL/FixJ family response regulator